MGEKRTGAAGGGIAVAATGIMAYAGSWPDIVHGPYHLFADVYKRQALDKAHPQKLTINILLTL